MSDQWSRDEHEPVATDILSHDFVLPEHLARRINRDVLAARARVIEERYRQRGKGSIYRRRYIEVIANHLLKTLENA